MRDMMRKYSWVDSEYDLALTVAVATGVRTADVIRAYGGDPDQALGSLTFDEAEVPADEFGQYFLLRVLESDDHVVAIENNGWGGSVPEIARRVTRLGGRYFSVYWNVNGLSCLAEAEDGRISAYFEPLFAGNQPGPGDVHPAWLGGGEFDAEHYKSASLAAMEQQAGVGFERAWLSDKLPTYRIPDPDVLLRDVPGARIP
jgi:hypothetical protein